jgi:hypothetical protein
MVSVTDPFYRILGFLDRIRYVFFQVAPQLYSRGWVDPVPDPIFLRKSGNVDNWTRTSGSVGRNSDHYTAEAVLFKKNSLYDETRNPIRPALYSHMATKLLSTDH